MSEVGGGLWSVIETRFMYLVHVLHASTVPGYHETDILCSRSRGYRGGISWQNWGIPARLEDERCHRLRRVGRRGRVEECVRLIHEVTSCATSTSHLGVRPHSITVRVGGGAVIKLDLVRTPYRSKIHDCTSFSLSSSEGTSILAADPFFRSTRKFDPFTSSHRVSQDRRVNSPEVCRPPSHAMVSMLFSIKQDFTNSMMGCSRFIVYSVLPT
jgi:hypothetical protein